MTEKTDTDLTGQTALVTGSTDGVGRAVAIRLGERGASVMVNGRTPEKGEAVVDDIEDAGGEAAFCRADITDYAEVAGLVEMTGEAFGGIDMLVASGAAGTAPPPEFFENTAPEELLAWCEHGFASRLYPVKAALDSLKEGGRVVLLTADAGKVATPGEVGPGAAAAAVSMATRVLAAELARYRITVNAVSLSVTRETPAARSLLPDSGAGDVFEKAFERQSFEVTPADAAELVVYLVGDDHAEPITGQIVSINGGVSFPG